MYNHLNRNIDIAIIINSLTFARSELIVVQKHYNQKAYETHNNIKPTSFKGFETGQR